MTIYPAWESKPKSSKIIILAHEIAHNIYWSFLERLPVVFNYQWELVGKWKGYKVKRNDGSESVRYSPATHF